MSPWKLPCACRPHAECVRFRAVWGSPPTPVRRPAQEKSPRAERCFPLVLLQPPTDLMAPSPDGVTFASSGTRLGLAEAAEVSSRPGLAPCSSMICNERAVWGLLATARPCAPPSRGRCGVGREPETPKLFGDLTLELLLSLQVVRDASRGLQNGAAHQVLPLAGQLRALLLEKRRDAHALLLHFATVAGVEPRLYVMPDPQTALLPHLPQPDVLISGFPFSTSRVLPKQVEIPLGDLVGRELVRHEARGYTIEELIKYYANRAGGSHYSRSIPESFARLLSYEVPGVSMRGLYCKPSPNWGTPSLTWACPLLAA